MFIIKMVDKNGRLKDCPVLVSYASAERVLFESGYYHSSGIYRHLDGSTAGISSVYTKKVFDNCHKPLNSRSSFARLINTESK